MRDYGNSSNIQIQNIYNIQKLMKNNNDWKITVKTKKKKRRKSSIKNSYLSRKSGLIESQPSLCDKDITPMIQRFSQNALRLIWASSASVSWPSATLRSCWNFEGVVSQTNEALWKKSSPLKPLTCAAGSTSWWRGAERSIPSTRSHCFMLLGSRCRSLVCQPFALWRSARRFRRLPASPIFSRRF